MAGHQDPNFTHEIKLDLHSLGMQVLSPAYGSQGGDIFYIFTNKSKLFRTRKRAPSRYTYLFIFQLWLEEIREVLRPLSVLIY